MTFGTAYSILAFAESVKLFTVLNMINTGTGFVPFLISLLKNKWRLTDN